MATEEEIKLIQKGTIYDIRRLIEKDGKDYTNAEILKLLDMIADSKDQES